MARNPFLQLRGDQPITDPATGLPTQYFLEMMFGTVDNAEDTADQIGSAVPSSRTITAGDGLSGGGDLSADRTIALDASLDDLNDVDFSTPPTDQQVMVFDEALGLWIPADQSGGGGGGGGPGLLVPEDPPRVADFTFAGNSGGALVDSPYGLLIQHPAVSGVNTSAATIPMPVGDFCFTVNLRALTFRAQFLAYGIGMRKASNGYRHDFFNYAYEDLPRIEVRDNNGDAAIYNTPQIAEQFQAMPRWMRISREGSTYRYFLSLDGINWSLYFSSSSALPMGIPDQLHLFTYTNGVSARMNLLAEYVELVSGSHEGSDNGLIYDFPGGGGGGGNWWFDPPSAASFTSVSGDAGSLTITDDADAGLLFDAGPAIGGLGFRGIVRTLTDKTQDFDMIVRFDYVLSTQTNSAIGLMLHDSVGNKQVALRFDQADNVIVTRYTSLTTENGNYIVQGMAELSTVNWMRIKRVGSNYEFYISSNGKVWILVSTQSVTGHLANPADKVGFYTATNRGSGFQITGAIEYFDLTGPAV